jgi:DNA-binding transcriptional ArsR family regulator
MDTEFLEQAADMLKSMGHPLRLKIVMFLKGGEQTVGAVSEAIGASQSATSQHLNMMKMKGILKSHRDATMVLYSVARPEVFKIIHCIEARQKE